MSRTADPQKKSGRTTFVLPENLKRACARLLPCSDTLLIHALCKRSRLPWTRQNPNETALESPIIERWRATLGKQTFGANLFKKVCELFEPANTAEMTEWHWNYFCELLKKHEGPLDRKTRDLYWKPSEGYEPAKRGPRKGTGKNQKTNERWKVKSYAKQPD